MWLRGNRVGCELMVMRTAGCLQISLLSATLKSFLPPKPSGGFERLPAFRSFILTWLRLKSVSGNFLFSCLCLLPVPTLLAPPSAWRDPSRCCHYRFCPFDQPVLLLCGCLVSFGGSPPHPPPPPSSPPSSWRCQSALRRWRWRAGLTRSGLGNLLIHQCVIHGYGSVCLSPPVCH